MSGRASAAAASRARAAETSRPRMLRRARLHGGRCLLLQGRDARRLGGAHGADLGSSRRRALAEEREAGGSGGAEEAAAAPSGPEVLSSLDLLTSKLERGEPCQVMRHPDPPVPAREVQAGGAGGDFDPRAPGSYLKQVLVARVYEVAVETELTKAEALSQSLGCTVLLKREDTQPVFSFKCRGAFNKMASLTEEERARGVICSSAGNHAQGVAMGAAHLNCRATICMPLITPEIKVEAVRRLGGDVVLVGDNYDECQAHAIRTAKEQDLSYIHPFDDPYVIAGQGTVGNEILRQCSMERLTDKDLSAIFVPVGGGGLLAGVATFVKQVRPDVKVFGVEPAGAACMAEAVMRGRLVTLGAVDAFADGVAVKTSGTETFRLISEFCDGILTVSTEEICAAIKDVFKDTRSILEPAGAVAVAGLKAYCKRNPHLAQGRAHVAITSGANMNFDRLRVVSDVANFGARTEAMMATTIPEQPGAFRAFVDALVGEKNEISVTEFKYRFAADPKGEAHVLYSVELREEGDQKEQMMARLRAAGMPTLDLSHSEAAQLHLRHLVGGRARSFTGAIPDERIVQVAFPEKAGALRAFLEELSPKLNVTLFHYRQTGNVETRVLIGVQIPRGEYTQFDAAMEKLGYRVDEIGAQAFEAFSMFLQ